MRYFLILLLSLIIFFFIFNNFIKFYCIENLNTFFLIHRFNYKNIYYSFYDELKYNLKIIPKYKYNIPNNIFQIWLNNDFLIPYDIYYNITKLKNINKDWKYYLITSRIIDKIFENEIDKFSLKIKTIYYNINPNYYAVKSDLIRYYLIYKYGGIYLDIKSNCKIGINNLINSNKIKLFNWCEPKTSFNFNKIFFPRMKKLLGPEIIQWFLLYPPNHYIIKIVLDNIINTYNLYKSNKDIKQDVYEFTGPILYSNIIYKYFNKKECELNNCFYNYLKFNNLNANHKLYYNKTHYSNLKEKIIF